MNFEFNLEGSLFDTVFQFEKSTTKPKLNNDLTKKPETDKRKKKKKKK